MAPSSKLVCRGEMGRETGLVLVEMEMEMLYRKRFICVSCLLVQLDAL